MGQGVDVNDHRKADYGIDAPHAVRNAALAGAAALVVGTGLSLTRSPSQPMLVDIARRLGIFIGVILLPLAGAQFLFSKVGKYRERDRLLDSIPWRRDETVLDVGSHPTQAMSKKRIPGPSGVALNRRQ